MQPVRGVIFLPKIPQMHRLAPRSKSMQSSIKNNMNTCCWWLGEKGKQSANPCTYPPIPAMFFGFHILQNEPSENFCNHCLSVCLSVWLTFCLSISQNLKRYYDIEAVASDRNDRKLTEAKERYTNNWRRIQALHKRLQLLEYRHVPFVSFTWPETLSFRGCKPCQSGGQKKTRQENFAKD